MRIREAFTGLRHVFLDTAPIIYHVQGNPAYRPLTRFVFKGIMSGSFEAVTSTVSLAECLVQPYRSGDRALVEQFREVITAGANTRFVGVDDVAERAAELRAQHRLALTDAFQVAAALGAGCDAILTNDHDLKRVTEIRVLMLADLEPLAIRRLSS